MSELLLDSNGALPVSIARRSPVRIPPRNGEKYSLLVVEDDPDLAQLVIDIFMTAGFEMHWASNRAEINQQMNRRPPVDRNGWRRRRTMGRVV